MHNKVDLNKRSLHDTEQDKRRDWQPPQAKVVDVAAVSRNTTISVYSDGATTCSS